ncbi:MAG: hypothetical protein K0S32_2811 [Bacteroidetes bacterium]|nr:hypothetical protein [Bacteroidota bacterium]
MSYNILFLAADFTDYHRYWISGIRETCDRNIMYA